MCHVSSVPNSCDRVVLYSITRGWKVEVVEEAFKLH